MDIESRLDQAIYSDEPRKYLGKVVKRLLEEGTEGDVILGELECFREKLSRLGLEEEADLILEVMDSLTGWCGPVTRSS